MNWPTRLFEFDGGVLEVYDYGDSQGSRSCPGFYLELRGPAEATRDAIRQEAS
ncbi:hypothetical protein DFR76_109275 [Nocardia pseudobrasiliensis]|uniref:Uncharacterized protein n=1 Tax=Nocardia pseudobrasiliensis TaxID=45979 RepID=A0A370HZK8_9NOCA|nr:hypothetical protein DFR76_109275 [Nocardia pseudobrasiliensis]